MKELQHVCMFKSAKDGFIQCTIKPIYKGDFEALGFVDSVDQLKKAKTNDKQRRTSKRNLRTDADKRADG